MFGKKLYRSDMINCALCHDAPCSSSCRGLDPATLLRSVWFDNEFTAAGILPDENPCADCGSLTPQIPKRLIKPYFFSQIQITYYS